MPHLQQLMYEWICGQTLFLCILILVATCSVFAAVWYKTEKEIKNIKKY